LIFEEVVQFLEQCIRTFAAAKRRIDIFNAARALAGFTP